MAAPNAKFAWCCHHAVELEVLIEPAVNRIEYIRDYKPLVEQIARFDNFRPVLSPLSAELGKAWDEHDKARAEYEKAWAEYEKAWAEHDKARAELGVEEIARLHELDVPGHTWNGHDIF